MIDDVMKDCRTEAEFGGLPCPTKKFCEGYGQCFGQKIGRLLLFGVPNDVVNIAIELCLTVKSQKPIDKLMEKHNVTYERRNEMENHS